MSDRPMSDLQRELRESQIHVINDAPLCCCEGVESETVIVPSRRSKIVARWVIGIVVFGIAFGMVAAGRAAERNQSGWVLWNLTKDEPYVSPRTKTVHYFSGEEACKTDMPWKIKGAPSGLRISCKQMKGEER